MEDTAGQQLKIFKPGLVLLVSEPGGGKTHLERYIMYENKDDIEYGQVFSPSAFRSVNFDYVPPYENIKEEMNTYHNFKHLQYDNDKLQVFLDYQSTIPKDECKLSVIWVDDDLKESKKMFNSCAMITAYTGFRHWKLLIIICT